MTTGRRTLDPKLDIVFWMLFGEERNRVLLLSLLNAVFRPTVPIDFVEVLHAEPERAVSGDKAIVLDVRVRLANGEQVDIEMQSQRRPALGERMLYYWARLYAGQLSRGEAYDELRRCAVVLFVSFLMLTGRRFHSTFRVREQTGGETLTGHLELHLLELSKLETALDDEPGLTLWGKFLCATTDEQLAELAMEHPLLKQAKDALEDLSADPEARVLAERRETALKLYKQDLGASFHEGKLEGKLEGKAQALSRLLSMKFGQVPELAALRLAAASEQELDTWIERVLAAETWEQVFEPAD